MEAAEQKVKVKILKAVLGKSELGYAKDALDYINILEKQLTIHSVSFSLPTNDEIEKQAEKALFGFGKGRQYDDDYWTGYEEGAKWIIDKCNKS
jgi:hypothetical protein